MIIVEYPSFNNRTDIKSTRKKEKLEQHYQSTRPNSYLKTSPLRASEYTLFSNAHGYTIC